MGYARSGRRMNKALIFRAISFSTTLLLARWWFGDWHITGFSVFLIFWNTAQYYAFDKAWANAMAEAKPPSRGGEGSK